MAYDKSKGTGASRGRALRIDACGLSKGDRLEPTCGLPDVASFDTLQTPATVLFWRPTAETFTKHRNPLFDDAIGITPERCVMIDWLHTLSLGIFQDFLAALFHKLFYIVNAWKVPSGRDNLRLLSVARLQADLFSWYGDESRRGKEHTRIQHLEASLFWTFRSPTCNLHGAETNGMLEFGAVLTKRFAAELGDSMWRQCAVSLVRVKTLITEHRQVFPASAIQDREG